MNENIKDIMKVAVDAIKGKVENYSAEQTSEGLRQALIELNGGSDKINPKTMYRGHALFELVQELIPVVIEEGLPKESPLFQLVDYRNIKYGDINEFYTEAEADFTVATVANGIRDIRRQRINGGTRLIVPTSLKFVRVYENLGRLLAGRIEFSTFIDGVGKAFNRQILDDAYAAIDSISATTLGLDSNYVKIGAFDEEKLLGLIENVEAATGKTARVLGTRPALRKITSAVTGNETNSDMYNLGYYARWNGTDLLCLKNAHKPGSSAFTISDNKLFIISSDDKPIKFINSGEGLLINKQAIENADLTEEYLYALEFGVGTICAAKLGLYSLS